MTRNSQNPTRFDHEKLTVYQRSIDFVAWSTDILELIPPKLKVCDQFDRASTSIPLNIAEGNGKFRPDDRCRYFDNARGSALECASCLDVAVARKLVPSEQADAGKQMLIPIVSMLVGLIKRQENNRLYEESEPYSVEERNDD